MNRWALLILMGLGIGLLDPGLAPATEGTSPEEHFFEANRAYKTGRFAEAAGAYLDLIAGGRTNGHIYYNLANAHLRSGDLGRAILYYERARLLLPRDDDLSFNLAYAQNRTRDAIGEERTSPVNSLLSLDSVNVYETFFVFVMLNVGFFGVLGLRLFKKPEWSYYLAIILGMAFVIGLGAWAFKWHGLRSDDRAVVLADEIEVHAGPDPADTVLFKLHAGAVVHYERAEGDWALLHLDRDKRGWAEAGRLERIVE